MDDICKEKHNNRVKRRSFSDYTDEFVSAVTEHTKNSDAKIVIQNFNIGNTYNNYDNNNMSHNTIAQHGGVNVASSHQDVGSGRNHVSKWKYLYKIIEIVYSSHTFAGIVAYILVADGDIGILRKIVINILVCLLQWLIMFLQKFE